jgi:hypothetical protein
MASADFIGQLQKLRAALVAKRRDDVRSSLETALANKEDRPSVSWAADIARIQEHIEAVDRAIVDEKELRHEQRRSRERAQHGNG